MARTTSSRSFWIFVPMTYPNIEKYKLNNTFKKHAEIEPKRCNW